MTGRRENSDDKIGQLEEALAILISCTRKKTRPLPLTEISMWVEVAVTKLGSYTAVADRIGLSAKMLRQFLCVRQLSNGVQRLFADRKLDSVDAAAHLAMLPVREQEAVANALAKGEINTIDLRAVVELRKSGKAISIKDLLRQVIDSKVRHEYVAEFVVRSVRSREEIRVALTQYIPSSEIVSLEITGALGRLVLTPKGKQAMAKAAQKLRLPLKQVIPTILHI